MSRLVVAIDGPAGAGKSTVAKRLAHELGLRYLDTGAMYRALALKASRTGLGPEDGEAAAQLGAKSAIEFGEGEPQAVLLDGEDVTAAIRTLQVGELASALSAHPAVRRVLASRQKELVAEGGFVLEGRDVTTVIAPEADVRVFLTATLQERARRRLADLVNQGESADLEQVQETIRRRDERDQNRSDSPLQIAPGVTVIESDGMSIDEVVERIARLASKQRHD